MQDFNFNLVFLICAMAWQGGLWDAIVSNLLFMLQCRIMTSFVTSHFMLKLNKYFLGITQDFQSCSHSYKLPLTAYLTVMEREKMRLVLLSQYSDILPWYKTAYNSWAGRLLCVPHACMNSRQDATAYAVHRWIVHIKVALPLPTSEELYFQEAPIVLIICRRGFDTDWASVHRCKFKFIRPSNFRGTPVRQGRL